MLLAVSLLSGCGAKNGDGEGSSPDNLSSSKLSACVEKWNGQAGSQVRPVVGQQASAQNDQPVRLFLFADGACGLTAPAARPDLQAFSTYVVRGGVWEPYINTRGAGTGQSPARSMLVVGQELQQQAAEQPNASVVATTGEVTLEAGATLSQVEYPSALTVQNLDGSTSADQAYVLDRRGWDTLSLDMKLQAVAAFAEDRNCSVDAVRQIGEALRDGNFEVEGDSLEATLASWCSGELGAASGSSAAGSDGATATGSASLDVYSKVWESYSQQTKLRLIKQFVEDTGCDLQIVASSYQEFVRLMDDQMDVPYDDEGTGRTAESLAQTLCDPAGG